MLRRQIILVLYFLVLMLGLQSCDKVNGLVPDKNTVPESTAKLLIENFPNAQNVIFKTVKENQLWEARFTEDKVLYYIGLNKTQIVATHRLLSAAVPDSMENIIRSYIPIAKNAALSDYQEDITNKLYRAKMTVDQTDYLIKWFHNGTALQIRMEDYSVFEFATDVRYEPLPDVLTEFSKRTNYFIVGLKTRVLSNNELVYSVLPENRADYIIVNEKGRLVSSYQSVETYQTFRDLPEMIEEKLTYFGVQSYELSVFTFKFFDDNTTGYRVLVYGGRGGSYYFFFDEDGNVTSLVNDFSVF